MTAPQRIFLIGPPGAGKTAVGRRLAGLLDYEFVDVDHYIEQRTGVDIPLIFDKEGEAGFRHRETTALDELTRRENVVVATGGGAVLAEPNRQVLRQRGYLVYLKTSLDQQYERTRSSKNRPLLHDDDPRARLEELMEIRGPLYEELAHLQICTDRRYVKSVAREIHRHLSGP
ncbi:MAG: shikimate kinase [Gammaproteobacteria bacterium]|nr:shikimate kinase [Gammaproteobacteria bacterium]NNF62217.1 shikimate kinase [Gammaproteobacteria bacterium]NNM21014.1 shikimate kinase [Gammaproteobacteria bacterium]